ncbi:hypothetical protein ACM25N_15720 [Roseovarius sp. C7]|uniref:hypothetical protein n=1 Tax=Roseovarius sp. C7 TaxID=3398643 RepID=UPI0039F69C35
MTTFEDTRSAKLRITASVYARGIPERLRKAANALKLASRSGSMNLRALPQKAKKAPEGALFIWSE